MPTSNEQQQVAVEPRDNEATVKLTEWLIMHDYFFEDGPACELRYQEEFGALADQLFARHRLNTRPAQPQPVGREAIVCRHEPYQGACAHCGIQFRDGRPVAALSGPAGGDAGADLSEQARELLAQACGVPVLSDKDRDLIDMDEVLKVDALRAIERALSSPDRFAEGLEAAAKQADLRRDVFGGEPTTANERLIVEHIAAAIRALSPDTGRESGGGR